mmetsp:Transcript_104576/g.295854  ORF Transcript_104576/g.295854 Transcript_104576/m.295854 type:complete len:305 (+) Transcript_104576:339-1253(+)
MPARATGSPPPTSHVHNTTPRIVRRPRQLGRPTASADPQNPCQADAETRRQREHGPEALWGARPRQTGPRRCDRQLRPGPPYRRHCGEPAQLLLARRLKQESPQFLLADGAVPVLVYVAEDPLQLISAQRPVEGFVELVLAELPVVVPVQVVDELLQRRGHGAHVQRRPVEGHRHELVEVKGLTLVDVRLPEQRLRVRQQVGPGAARLRVVALGRVVRLGRLRGRRQPQLLHGGLELLQGDLAVLLQLDVLEDAHAGLEVVALELERHRVQQHGVGPALHGLQPEPLQRLGANGLAPDAEPLVP